jgi:hypothetical protein
MRREFEAPQVMRRLLSNVPQDIRIKWGFIKKFKFSLLIYRRIVILQRNTRLMHLSHPGATSDVPLLQ